MGVSNESNEHTTGLLRDRKQQRLYDIEQ